MVLRFGGMLLLVVAPVTWATSLQFAPTRLEFDEKTRVKELRITNRGTEAVLLELEAFRWNQPEGASALEATSALLASPPLLEVASGEHASIRLGFTDTPTAPCELTYRVWVTEVSRQSAVSTPIRLRYRVSLPVFRRITADCTEALTWTRLDSPPRLRVQNNGGAHAQIQEARRTFLGQVVDLEFPEVGYVLPGQYLDIPLSADATAGDIELRTRRRVWRGDLRGGQ